MATSGSYDWTLTRAQAISGALRKLGVLASGTGPDANQTNDAVEALNAIVKAFQADGMPLWAIQSHTFQTVASTTTYTIGPSQTINLAYAPLKVLQASRQLSGSFDIDMVVVNRYDTAQLTNTITGTPNILYYQPTITNGVSTGIITLWPIPNDSTTNITIDFQRPFQDMDSTTNNFDFPQYWMQAIIYYLAWSLAPEYGIPPTDRGLLQKEAMYWKNEALSYGSEEGSVFFQPNRN